MGSPFGRGITDIAAQGIKFPIFVNGVEIPTWGTSCSAPVRLSLVAPSFSLRSSILEHPVDRQCIDRRGHYSLLNDYLLSQGKAPLDFLNPWLYSDGRRGLNDIESGWNPGCCTNEFPSVVGWDPVRSIRLVSPSLSTLADDDFSSVGDGSRVT